MKKFVVSKKLGSFAAYTKDIEASMTKEVMDAVEYLVAKFPKDSHKELIKPTQDTHEDDGSPAKKPKLADMLQARLERETMERNGPNLEKMEIEKMDMTSMKNALQSRIKK